MTDNIFQIDLEKEMRKSYLDYSMSVIVSRALPDVRDGLKPVHRRILYGMNELNLTPDKPTRKSARIVGDVMGKFHPHGDSAIYEAIVRLAQDFSTRYPLVLGQGNFGSVDGDEAAAMRYTEAKMTKLTMEMLKDIDKETVPFIPNFDESEQEPTVLPSGFPNLLVNGSSGIAVGMSTNMAPHNLKETIDATIAYIDDFDISIDKLSKYIKGPDFPTGALIMGKAGIKKAYETGRGKVKLRALAQIEDFKKNRKRIIVTEIPYQVNKSRLIMKIADLVKDKKLDGISDIRDESDRNGMRIVIEVKRDHNAQIVLNNLYKMTQMETTFGIINLALVNGVPKILNLKELIKEYVDHRKTIVTNRTIYDLKRAKNRLHIVEGLIIAIEHIDEIIKIIRSSYDDKEIKKIFNERYELTEVQSQAILDMRLKRLSGLEIEKLRAENDELLKKISYLTGLLDDETKLFDVIKDELREIQNQFKDKRRTKIMADEGDIDIEELIKKEDVIITLTNAGYIKRSPVDTYKVQKRGGKGISALKTKKGDFIKDILTTNTHDNIIFFTDKGKAYSLKSFEIPEGQRTSRGVNIVNILKIDNDESITQMLKVSEIKQGMNLFMQTANGYIKNTEAINFKNINRNGIIAITLREDDRLISVRLTDNDGDLIISSKKGKCVRIKSTDIRQSGRQSMGIIAMKLQGEDDQVVSMAQVTGYKSLFVITELGYGKRCLLSEIKCKGRAIKGAYIHKITEKTGDVLAVIPVKDEDELMIVSLKGDIIRINLNDINTLGRVTSGVKIKNVKDDEDKIVAISKYFDEQNGDEDV